MVFDPSHKIERFFDKDGRMIGEEEEWEPYKPLVLYEAAGCKKLGNGWYLIYFT